MPLINEINKYSDLIEAKKQKEKLINDVNAEFIKKYNIATINLTKDILLNVIPDKINSLIEQLKNPIIVKAENEKLKKLESINKEKIEFRKEQKSILSIVTSNLKFKKAVSNIEKASTSVIQDERYVATIGENGTSFQQLLDGLDLDLAKRYVELSDLLLDLKDQESLIYKDFDSKIKDVEYISDNFDEELEELRNISKVNWYSISTFNEDEYYLFYGQDKDYDIYFKQIKKIKELYKQYCESKKESLNWEIN